MSRVVGFVPGNGHVDARLDPAREKAQLLEAGFELRSVRYPGLQDWSFLLSEVRDQLADADFIYATGIGGLVVLALRAEGHLLEHPTVLQGPVLWGLETRTFPKIMRAPLMPRLLVAALKTRVIRRRFVNKHFVTTPSQEFRNVFFAGYDDAPAFQRWFGWLTPGLLRELEGKLRGRTDLFEGVTAWWGGQDHVVGIEELRLTEAALDVTVPVKEFPSWGHYPMIDDPMGWCEEVALALATAR